MWLLLCSCGALKILIDWLIDCSFVSPRFVRSLVGGGACSPKKKLLLPSPSLPLVDHTDYRLGGLPLWSVWIACLRTSRGMWCLWHAGALAAWRRRPVCACTRECWCRRIFTYIHGASRACFVCLPFKPVCGSGTAPAAGLTWLKAPTPTEARVEANGEYRVKLAERNYKAQVLSRL